MTIKEILSSVRHRPWEMPIENWKFYQEWNNVIFLHWPVNYEELRKLVHPDLELDLFDGMPWLSLVAFDMEKIRPKNLPACNAISNFHEINIRTYVKYKGKSGVHFLSIEAANQWSSNIAKWMSELPYRHSIMSRDTNSFNSVNLKLHESFKIKYTVGEKLNVKEKLDFWLTERYALFQNTDFLINEFEIHHIEWPINKIVLDILEINYPRFEKLIHDLPINIHYSQGVQVIAWGKKQFQIVQRF